MILAPTANLIRTTKCNGISFVKQNKRERVKLRRLLVTDVIIVLADEKIKVAFKTEHCHFVLLARGVYSFLQACSLATLRKSVSTSKVVVIVMAVGISESLH